MPTEHQNVVVAEDVVIAKDSNFGVSATVVSRIQGNGVATLEARFSTMIMDAPPTIKNSPS